MRVVQWARLQSSASCGLRLGAWYPVVVLAAREAHVRVHGQVAKLPRSLLELRVAPPCEWTVVRGPLNAARVPAGARGGYVVCPNCRHRDPLPDARVATARCPRCNQVFAVAWDEAYPRVAQGGRERALVRAVGPQAVTRPMWDTLAPDRRMTRRRSTANRRTGLERRTAERRALILATTLVERRVAERRQPTKRRNDRDRRSRSERRRRAATW
ncbi:MAG TPA: hypothetical protein VFU41_15785 [Gemmatimonadales bacterium]|nr:hypothetical protein [Gemmatimonadales bacterium]